MLLVVILPYLVVAQGTGIDKRYHVVIMTPGDKRRDFRQMEKLVLEYSTLHGSALSILKCCKFVVISVVKGGVIRLRW